LNAPFNDFEVFVFFADFLADFLADFFVFGVAHFPCLKSFANLQIFGDTQSLLFLQKLATLLLQKETFKRGE